MDTATGEMSPLEPRHEGQLAVYLCGPTVAGCPHFGHARMNLTWDVLRRYLTWNGFKVRFVSNVTDIEDKIMSKAAEEGTTASDVAARYEQLWFDVMGRLNVKRPDDVPHATEYVARMVELIGDLVGRGHAYVGGDGVYMEVASVPGYGLLARQDLDSLKAGARVEVEEAAGKRSPLDFVLWKFSKPGEPVWPSPWGDGRPGWHTECVVMSLDLLGQGFDLHLGGLDLAFPHHENERAQAVAAGLTFARRWAHNGIAVDAQGDKMSRSVGNVTSLVDLVDSYDPRALRALVLQAHYRSPMAVSAEALESAQGAVTRLDNFAREMANLPTTSPDPATLERFRWRMDDDLDTPGALSVVFGAVRDARAHPERAPALAAAVRECCEAAWGLQLAGGPQVLPGEVVELVHKRDKARANRDWPEADRLRSQLQAMGYVVEDGPQGTTAWRER